MTIKKIGSLSAVTTARKLILLLAAVTCLTAYTAPTSAQARDEIVYFHNDALGTAIAAFNENGERCWRQTYTPYGEQTDTADRNPPSGCGLLGNERGYTGHTQDSSGLVYMQQRYYDPGLGRFLSIDPSGVNVDDPRTFNRYMYAANNPYKYTDPDGRIVFLALVPAVLKAIDIAITAAEVTAAAQSGGTTAVASVVAESVATSLVPGGKILSKLSKAKSNFTFRGDSRKPDEIFANGFEPRGKSTDLEAHAWDNTSPPSAYVSTSKSADVASEFAENVYVVRPRNGIDVNATLGNRSPFPDELEIAVPDGISPSDIRAVTRGNVSTLNPDFIP